MQVEDAGVRVSFLKVRPGDDDRLTKRLGNWQKAHGYDWLRQYHCLGDPDAVVISPLEPDSSDGRDGIPILDVRGDGLVLNELYGFVVSGNGNLHETLGRDLVVVSALKLSDALIHELGVEADDQVMKLIHERFSEGEDRSACVLGGMGWYELILLLGGDDITAMTKDILELRRCTTDQLPAGQLRSLKGVPLFETSYTTVAITDEFADRVVREGHQPASTDSASVHARISVMSRPSRMGAAIQSFRRHFGTDVDRRSPLGKGELVAVVEGSFRDVLKRLWTFRRASRSNIIDTNTSVEIPIDEALTWPSPPRQAPKKLTKISLPSLGGLRASQPLVYHRVSKVLGSFSQFMRDGTGSDVFLDMIPFIRRLAHEAAATDSKALTPQALNSACSVYEFAVAQRFAGSYASWHNPHLITRVGPQGGVQRILRASEAVVGELYRVGKVRGAGFAVFGHSDEARRLDFGVVNLPWSSLIRPGQWFLLFHEVGHEFEELVDAQHDPALRALFREYQGFDPGELDQGDLDRAHDAADFYWELVADYFDFHVGFRGKWSEYVTVVGAYLDEILTSDPMIDERLAIQVTRLIFVRKQTAGRQDLSRHVTTPDRFKAWWLEVLRELRRNVKSTEVLEALVRIEGGSVYLHEAWDVFVRWRSIQSHMADRLRSQISSRQPQIARASTDRILSGKPLPSVPSAISLIRWMALAEARGVQMTFGARVACMLTLWSTVVRGSETRRRYDLVLAD